VPPGLSAEATLTIATRIEGAPALDAIEPVDDWGIDYDIFADEFVADPFRIFSEIRASGCPVAHSDRWGGSHMPTTFEDVSKAARDHQRFSSEEVFVVPVPHEFDDQGNRLRSIIITPPEDHTPQRHLMLPFFTPKAVERFREPTRELCCQLAHSFVEDGKADVAGQYARHIPPRVIAELLGIDPARSDEFTEWVHGTLVLGLKDPEARAHYTLVIREFIVEEIAHRQENPGDDFISFLLAAEIDGEPMPMHVLRHNVGLMLIAGIDTTWSSIGAAFWHLAAHPQDRQRLVDEPALIPAAVEELLRAYAPVTMARLASTDTTLNDSDVAAGDRVLLTFPSANRDPAVFENPDVVDFDRKENRHIAFGAGIHRCLGSNVARMEMAVAIEEFLKVIPDFELADPDAVTWSGGQVRGPRYLPISFPARSL
jgi:cytochrome P450